MRRTMIVLAILSALATSRTTLCAPAPAPLQIVFDGSNHSELDAVEGVDDVGTGPLVLLADHAAGHVLVKVNKLPEPGSGQTVTKVTLRADGVLLDGASGYVQTVSLRSQIGAKILVATLRAYRPKRTDDVKVECLLRDVSAGTQQRDEVTGLDLSAPNRLVLEVANVTGTDRASVSVGPAGSESLAVTLDDIPIVKATMVRLELGGNARAKTTPSVALLTVALEVSVP